MNRLFLLLGAFLIGCTCAGTLQQWRLDAHIARAIGERNSIKFQCESRMREISDHAASAAEAAQIETTRAASAIADAQYRYQMEQRHAEREINDLRNRVRTRDLRLRAPVSDDPPPSDSTTADARSAVTRIDGAGIAELDATTADALFDITRDGDRAARKVNALQAYIREALRVCGPRG